jgi:hypothetical protein
VSGEPRAGARIARSGGRNLPVVLAMHPSLSTDQLQLLFEASTGMPEPATLRVLQDLGALRRLGLLSLDGGGRYEITQQGRDRLAAETPRLHLHLH